MGDSSKLFTKSESTKGKGLNKHIGQKNIKKDISNIFLKKRLYKMLELLVGILKHQ